MSLTITAMAVGMIICAWMIDKTLRDICDALVDLLDELRKLNKKGD